MLVNTKMVHRIDTPVRKFSNADELFDYTKSLNSEDNIKRLKKANQIVATKTPKRNAPCICGSGKKFKKCCINKEAV